MYNKLFHNALVYMQVRFLSYFVIFNIFTLTLTILFNITFVLFIVLLIISFSGFLFTYLGFKFYGYKLDVYEVAIRSGYIVKKYIYMPYSRIQQIEVEVNILERVLGLSRVSFITAGSKTKIKYIKYNDAQNIRRDLLSQIGDSHE